MGVFKSKSCNPNPSDLASLSPFCLPSCVPFSSVSVIQEPPMVVVPVADPPNIDFGCFPIKTEAHLYKGGGVGAFDLIVDYSKQSLSKSKWSDSSGSSQSKEVFRYDFCQPIIKAALTLPPTAAEVYQGITNDDIGRGECADVTLLVQQSDGTYKKDKDEEACSIDCIPKGAKVLLWRSGNTWTVSMNDPDYMPREGVVIEADGGGMEAGEPGSVRVQLRAWDDTLDPEDEKYINVTVPAINLSPFKLLTNDQVIVEYIKIGNQEEECIWVCKHVENCWDDSVLAEDIAAGAFGEVEIVPGVVTLDIVENRLGEDKLEDDEVATQYLHGNEWDPEFTEADATYIYPRIVAFPSSTGATRQTLKDQISARVEPYLPLNGDEMFFPCTGDATDCARWS